MNYLPLFYFSPSQPSRWWANLRLGKFQCLKLSFFTQLWASLRQGETVCKCRRAKNIQGENKPVYDKPSNWKHKLFSQKEEGSLYVSELVPNPNFLSVQLKYVKIIWIMTSPSLHKVIKTNWQRLAPLIHAFTIIPMCMLKIYGITN